MCVFILYVFIFILHVQHEDPKKYNFKTKSLLYSQNKYTANWWRICCSGYIANSSTKRDKRTLLRAFFLFSFLVRRLGKQTCSQWEIGSSVKSTFHENGRVWRCIFVLDGKPMDEGERDREAEGRGTSFITSKCNINLLLKHEGLI